METLKIEIEDGLIGELTTDHAASSYGQPVLVINGQAYGREDISPVSGMFGVPLTASDLVRGSVPWWDDNGDGRFDIADKFLGKRQPRPSDPRKFVNYDD